MGDNLIYTKAMLCGLLTLSGYIDDVASRMIALAKLQGDDSIVECIYGKVTLTARKTTNIADIRTQFEKQCYKRLAGERIALTYA